MNESNGAENVRLSEEQVRRIIERAAAMPDELDRISYADLREIAAELDIDEKRLQRAFTQELIGHAGVKVGALTGIERITGTRNGRAAVFGSVLGIGSGLIGLTNRFVVDGITFSTGSNAYIDVPVAIALAAISLVFLAKNRKAGSLRRFLGEVGSLWGTFFGGWAAVSGGPTDDLARYVLSSLACSAIVGFLVLRRKGAKPLNDRAAPIARANQNDSKPVNQGHEAFSWDRTMRRLRLAPA